MAEVIVITGGSSGIGGACVALAAARGLSVFNLDRNPPGEGAPEQAYLQTDLADAASIEASFQTIKTGNRIVGLVNNAGLSISHSIEETDIADFDRLVPLNLIGPMLCTKHSVASMKEAGWGRIVNITSRGALGKEKRSAYAATKGGLAAMTRVWALELAEFGITANNVGPGPIATELFRAVNPDDSPATQQIIESVPVKRLGTPDDVASAVMFFLDRNSGFVTGQTLYVCGGLTVGLSEV